jgi:hypothetical protein
MKFGRNCPLLQEHYERLQKEAKDAYLLWKDAESKFTLDLLASVGVVPPCRVIVVETYGDKKDGFLASIRGGELVMKKVKKDGTSGMHLLYLWNGIKEILPHGAGEKRESQNG